MRRPLASTASRYADATYWAVMMLSVVSVAELGWAFFAAGSTGLTSQQTTISNYFFALLGGSAGFFFGGVVLTVSGQLTPALKLSIKAIGGSALFLIALYHPLFPIAPGKQFSADNVESIGSPVEIKSPSTNSVVGGTVEVRGHTTHPSWRHFIVVTGPAQGSDVVQDAEVTVSPSGEILGTATLGNAAVGAGQSYTIRVVACEKRLEPGPFIRRNDLVFSNAITVTRSVKPERS
jgi:hypothetical protein